MRPESLYFLFSGINRLKGVGGATAAALQRLLPISAQFNNGLPVVRDLLFHLPVDIVDRRFTCPLMQAPKDVVATFVVKVDSHHPPNGRSKVYKVVCSDENGGTISLIFFHAQGDFLKRELPVGARRVISGKTEHFDFRLQMTHPDYITTVDKLAEVMKVEPVYPLTVGLTSRRIAKIVDGALQPLPDLPEWISGAWAQAQHWPGWKAALTAAHHPQTAEDLSPAQPARKRLAYDEILAAQLHLGMLKRSLQSQAARILKGDGRLTRNLRENLPFALTAGQEQVLSEIESDMASGGRMVRLLQGDVGSGKTVVALFAMLKAVEEGAQGALMVPTEVIAQQHAATLTRLTAGLGVTVGLLSGQVKGKARADVLAGIADGSIQLVVGTHALFQEQVVFNDLALVVIDEQHRFGVGQRMALSAKGTAPHLLHMTATPIPRSLTMTLYGDMDCSVLREKPAGRQPIATRVIGLSRYDEVVERLQAALDRGEKAYWICPLIEESSGQWAVGSGQGVDDSFLSTAHCPLSTDLAAAQTRHTEFTARFGPIVGLMHGRMKGEERNEQMRRFATGDTRLLVATTVVEVGVDVPDATIMVIEQAERFGLSQLHQLRGRVGRGSKPSACVLLYNEDAAKSENTVQRLSIMRESEDGFAIAEADLAIRGGGDVAGTRQSGLPLSIFTRMPEHRELLEPAREEAKGLLQADPDLSGEQGARARLLLELFGFASGV